MVSCELCKISENTFFTSSSNFLWWNWLQKVYVKNLLRLLTNNIPRRNIGETLKRNNERYSSFSLLFLFVDMLFLFFTLFTSTHSSLKLITHIVTFHRQASYTFYRFNLKHNCNIISKRCDRIILYSLFMKFNDAIVKLFILPNS